MEGVMSTIRSGAATRAGILRRTAGGLAAVFWSPLAMLVNATDWRERARQRAVLSTLDDRMLRDIGIDSASAAREAGKPFWER
jgi:uncharacterized protein YjiS (DUF1127 family)